MFPAIFASTVLVFADVIDNFRAGALPVRQLLDRTGVGEDLQHRPRRPRPPRSNALATLLLVFALLAVTVGYLVYREEDSRRCDHR